MKIRHLLSFVFVVMLITILGGFLLALIDFWPAETVFPALIFTILLAIIVGDKLLSVWKPYTYAIKLKGFGGVFIAYGVFFAFLNIWGWRGTPIYFVLYAFATFWVVAGLVLRKIKEVYLE